MGFFFDNKGFNLKNTLYFALAIFGFIMCMYGLISMIQIYIEYMKKPNQNFINHLGFWLVLISLASLPFLPKKQQ